MRLLVLILRASFAAAFSSIPFSLVDWAPPKFGDGVTKSDCDAVVEQLGYMPTNLVEIAARGPPRRSIGGPDATSSHSGSPTVLRCYPLVRERATIEPFPTMFWLACPQVLCVDTTASTPSTLR